MLPLRRSLSAMVAITLCAVCPGQKVRFNAAAKPEIVERARNAPQSDLDRAARLELLFRNSGCESYMREQKRENTGAPTIICELNSEAHQTIIVGAHYLAPPDLVHPGTETDNWTGAVMLPAIYECLKGRKRRHRIIFVAFADRGDAVASAEYFTAHLTEDQLRHTSAMINIDALGLSPTKVWGSHSDKDLVHSLVVMVYALKLPASQINIDAVGSDDSEPFAARKVPQITVHSFTRQHLDGSVAMQFHPGNYYDSYRLLCGYIAYLDKTLKSRAHAGPAPE